MTNEVPTPTPEPEQEPVAEPIPSTVENLEGTPVEPVPEDSEDSGVDEDGTEE